MKNFACLLLAAVMAVNIVTVTLDGEELAFDVPPQIINDSTFVPMRAIFEALGATVEFDDYTRVITAMAGSREIIMQLDNPIMTINGEQVELPNAPRLVDERTLVPVRAVAEGLSVDVGWDEDTRTVHLESTWASRFLTTPALSPLNGVFLGYGGYLLEEINFITRHLFEQTAFPFDVHLMEDILLDSIQSGATAVVAFLILQSWNLTVNMALATTMEALGEFETEQDFDDFLDWLGEMQYEGSGMTNRGYVAGQLGLRVMDHIPADAANIVEIAPSTNIVVIDLVDTGYAMLSTHIAIAYVPGRGISVFTLERSWVLDDYDNEIFFFCTVSPWGRQSLWRIANDREMFLSDILHVITYFE